MTWERLIRFVGDDDKVHFGEAQREDVEKIGSLVQSNDLYARELVGHNVFSLKLSEKHLHVKKLLGPLEPSDVPIIRCIGLNYTKHSWSQRLLH